jgi:hypothetical protein
MAEKQTNNASVGEQKALETRVIHVPKLAVSFKVMDVKIELPNGRDEYSMVLGSGSRTISFARRLLHRDELGGSTSTYYSDGVVSNWDWTKDRRGSDGVLY